MRTLSLSVIAVTLFSAAACVRPEPAAAPEPEVRRDTRTTAAAQAQRDTALAPTMQRPVSAVGAVGSGQQRALVPAPSGRATTAVTLRRPRAQGEPAPATPEPPRVIRIDYGQPHARGRQIFGNVVPMDSIWRTGANEATTLTTDVDLMIGGVHVPAGSYTLWTRPSASGWKLILNRQTGQWGTQYRPEHDLAQVNLRVRTLTEPLESFSIWLVPEIGAPARGVLRLAWADRELSTDWSVHQ